MTPDAAYAVPDAAAAAVLRADVYALLGTLLARAPSSSRLEQMAHLDVRPDVPPALAQVLADLKTAAAHADFEAVAHEYHTLFVGLGRGEVMPYASWHEDRTLMGAPLARLRRDLVGMDIRRRPTSCEPEDHAAALCEIMRLLVADSGISPEGQAAFFHAHLAPWMSRFFKDLRDAPSAAFYRSLGRLGEVFMGLEHDLLPDLPPQGEMRP
jgi:TorA maturation chaperone TorD